MSNVIFDRYDFLSLGADFGTFMIKVFWLIRVCQLSVKMRLARK